MCATCAVLPASQPAASPLTILIVEDHHGTRKAVMALLESTLDDCHVMGSESAEAALALIAEKCPDIVVMDISLPGISGIEATRRIKKSYPQAIVVMHSSSDQEIFRSECLAAGAAAFVAKATSSKELVPVITSLVSRDRDERTS